MLKGHLWSLILWLHTFGWVLALLCVVLSAGFARTLRNFARTAAPAIVDAMAADTSSGADVSTRYTGTQNRFFFEYAFFSPFFFTFSHRA